MPGSDNAVGPDTGPNGGDVQMRDGPEGSSPPAVKRSAADMGGEEDVQRESDSNSSSQPVKKCGESKNSSDTGPATQDEEMAVRARSQSVDMIGHDTATNKDIKKSTGTSSGETGSSNSDSVYPTPSSMSTYTASTSTREESMAQEPATHPCHDAPSIDEQVAKVSELLLRPLKEKQKGYVVSSAWLNRVISRSSQRPKGDKVDKTAAEGEIGPVDNSDIVLVTDPSTTFNDEAGEPFVPLRPGLNMGEDYEMMPQEAWDLVMKWYGLSEKSPAIVRYAHNTSPAGSIENVQYELNPPIFTILKLINPNTGTTMQTLKDKNRAPVKILASRHTPFQTWLKEAKEMASIEMSTKVRVWRILGGLNSGNSSGMVTPAASRSASPAPGATLTANAGNSLTLDANTFSSLGDGSQKELVEGKDQTMNEKYNGSSTLDLAGLGRDEVIVLEEQIGGPGGGEWISDSISQAGTRLGVKTTGAKYGSSKLKSKSATTSGRSSPAPVVTRGRQRKDGKTRGVTGLSNLGNTCYMNSALQCVRSVEELAHYFLRDVYKRDLNPSNPLSHNGEVAKAYAHLLHQIYDENGPSSFAPRNIKQTIGRYGPTFTGYGQQDSQEFLLFLLDGLQEDLNRIINKPYIEKPDSTDEMVYNNAALKEFADKNWEIYKARNDSVITDLFAGMYKSTVVCPDCDKVSIIFDPFNNLTLQLPIENLWAREVFFFPLHKKPVIINVEIDKDASIKALKEFVAKKTGANPQRLVMAEIWKFKFYKMFDNNTTISDSQISQSDEIGIFEVEAVPTNYDPDSRDKSRSLYSMTMPFNRQDEEIPDFDSPKADRMLVPVFNRVQGNGNKWEPFGAPSYVIVTRDEAMDFDSILRKLLAQAATMTTRDILHEGESRHGTEGPSEASDTVIMKEEDAESADSKIKASSVEGEDGLVDVSMRDAADSSQSGGAMDLCGTENKKNLPAVLQPGSFIPPTLRNMFDVTIMKSNTEVVPLGHSHVNNSKDFMPMSSRLPQENTKRVSERHDEGYYGGTDNSPASSDDELSEAPPPVNKTLPRPADSDDSDESDIFPQSYRTTHNRRNKGKAPRQDRFGNDIEEPEPDVGPLIRPGEGLVLDWNKAVHDSLFCADPTTRSDFHGEPTWTTIPHLPDPELASRRERRQRRKKNGISLGECLDEFGKEEILSENDAWYCPRCKEHRRASKKFELWKTPDILVMHLKRFSASRGFRDKIDVLVDFPIEQLDLTGRVAMPEDGKSLVYDLFGVDNHYGGLGGGHYTAYAKSFIDNNWYEYNDSHVSKKNVPHSVVTPAAYLLFYRRRSDHPLGGEALQEIVHEANKPADSDESQTESGANSPAGEGRRLGDSSRNGSSSAFPEAGAAHQAGDGGLQDERQARSDDELPDYSGGLRVGEKSLQGNSSSFDALDMDERFENRFPTTYGLGSSTLWSFDRASDSGPSRVTVAPPGSSYDADEDLFDDDAASNKAVAEGDLSDTEARLAGLGDMDNDTGGESPGTLFDDSIIQDIPPPLAADEDQGDELPVVELRVGDEERIL